MIQIEVLDEDVGEECLSYAYDVDAEAVDVYSVDAVDAVDGLKRTQQGYWVVCLQAVCTSNGTDHSRI